MIDLYTWPTPNGRKIHIALEELAVSYRVHPIDIYAGEQRTPPFTSINPHGKIPVIVDHAAASEQPLVVRESGAILIYLAEKHKKLLPAVEPQRSATLQWLMFQMSSIGPMFGQAYHWLHYASEQNSAAVERYGDESRKLFEQLDSQLKSTDYLAGNDYTIADIAVFPWIATHAATGIDLDDYPAVRRWRDQIFDRPAVKKGWELLADRRRRRPLTGSEHDGLFGRQNGASGDQS